MCCLLREEQQKFFHSSKYFRLSQYSDVINNYQVHLAASIVYRYSESISLLWHHSLGQYGK